MVEGVRAESGLEGETVESSSELLTHASRVLVHTWGRRLATLGITPASYLALSTVAAHPRLHQGALAQSLHVRVPTIRKILERLERRGWVKFYRSPTDARYRMIRATTEGRQIAHAGRHIEVALLAEAESLRVELQQLVSELIEHAGAS